MLITMKSKYVIFIIITLIIPFGFISCTTNDYDPEDYVTSILSGEYEKDGFWKLIVTENGKILEDYNYVRFDSKTLQTGDFKFVEVIPGIPILQFKNIPLKETETGFSFRMVYNEKEKHIIITGIISFGEMTINLSY